MKKHHGFTLIEVLVYIALFLIMMGGGILTAYNLIESSIRSQAENLVYNEGNFLLSKINWVTTGSTAVTAPAPGVPGSLLGVTKIGGSTVSLMLSGNNMIITYGSSAPIILNNSTIAISNLSFSNQTSSASQSIGSSFTVTTLTGDGKVFSKDFSTVKYIRK